MVTSLAGAAGALLIDTNRAILTAGVMVALALVPGAAIAALAVVSGGLEVAASGALRWAVEVSLVLLTSLLVLFWKRSRVQRRSTVRPPCQPINVRAALPCYLEAPGSPGARATLPRSGRRER